jgi:enoyl-CoA hydratase
MDFSHYEHVLVDRRDGIAVLTLNRPDKLNAMTGQMHYELSRIWVDFGDDPETRVVVVTGAGRAFSAGGDLDWIAGTAGNPTAVMALLKEVRDLVHNMINLDKPVISAINGVAVGAGAAVALMADISIAAENARFLDGHHTLGIAAGDHAAAIWPLLIGMAKAKYYLMTAEPIDAREAERLGLISLVVPPADLMPTAMRVAEKLANGPAQAIRWTKLSLNQWLRMAALTSFDYSSALEMLGMLGDDVREGVRALQDRRPPAFQPPRT